MAGTSTYTDADVARYAGNILDMKYPPEQAGPLKVLIETLLLQDRLHGLDVDQSDSGHDASRTMRVEITYRKERPDGK